MFQVRGANATTCIQAKFDPKQFAAGSAQHDQPQCGDNFKQPTLVAQ